MILYVLISNYCIKYLAISYSIIDYLLTIIPLFIILPSIISYSMVILYLLTTNRSPFITLLANI